MLGITNQLLCAAAADRGWQVEIVSEDLGVVRYTTKNGSSHYVKSVQTTTTNAWQVLVAHNKGLLYKLAESWGIAVPSTLSYQNYEQAKDFLNHHKKIVVKPQSGAHGVGITTNVSRLKQLQQALQVATALSPDVLLQKHMAGDDYRLLYIGGKFAAAAIRHPASIVGDGVLTCREIIVAENKRPERSEDYETPLNRIDVAGAERFLGAAMDAIIDKGEVRVVVGTANIGTGGVAEDVTAIVPPAVRTIADKIVSKLQLSVVGVDVIYDLEPVLLEINTSPSLGLHAYPFKGSAQPVATLFLDWLQTLPSQL